jgi:hypothetical protein
MRTRYERFRPEEASMTPDSPGAKGDGEDLLTMGGGRG